MKTGSIRPSTAGDAMSGTGNRLFPSERRREDRSGGLEKRQLLAALTRLKKGNFDVLLPEDRVGLDGKIADTFNEVVELHKAMSRELERLSHVVGKRGRLSERASLFGVGGSWAASMQSVNALIGDLVHPISETARVIGAVAKGDLSQTMALESDGRPLEGEFLSTARTVNTMVDQLSSFASEVTRVAREVGTEGKLGGQALVVGVSGTWKDLTDSVNLMASNLTAQVRNIAAVTTAVANGDLTKKITVDVQGEILELKDTVNTMVDQLRSFASEVTRVAGEVGTEGKLGGQAVVPGVAGTWKDLTDNVNSMASNLTAQVRNIADVTKAVANGDLSKKITVDVKGEIRELKDTINTMVDQLSSFASEVTRVAREVGTEGKLGGQAEVAGVAGTWKDLTDNVNSMAGNLTAQVRNIADVTTAVARGDLSRKITVDVQGEIRELKDTINTMVDQLSSFASEVTRVAREVGTEGKLGGQADVRGVAGTWKDLTDNVNSMAGNLTAQVRNIAGVTTAVAKGDLSKKITVDVQGEIRELKDTINTMVDQLSSFASEVTRVAREVGTEGNLGGQAEVAGVSGTWKDLTDNVNSMAGNLTSQVRGIARVVAAVANGNLKRKLTVEAKGEIAALADTINGMIDTLATFAEQVTSVAREVGVEGKLGGQASVPGAAGTWKDLTDNVNQLAANLTTQVRAIAEVATAVTKGDLTRSIAVQASGEVAALKDNINEMIRNLKDTTQENSEQDWLKTNLAKFSRMLQGQRDLLTVARLILSELVPVVSAQQAVFYTLDNSGAEPKLKLLASYATKPRSADKSLKLGEGLVGQCALEKHKILLTRVPKKYLSISSGLGEAAAASIIVLPVLFEGSVKAVLELASVEKFNSTHQALLDQLTESIGIVLNTIEANTLTEDLLKQSQSLAAELQSQQEELQQTNQKLEEKAALLVEQNAEVERKNMEVEQARVALEEKAEQLALTSRYKSEFLANMSHELRTPLNSLLILSDQLSKNPEGNLTSRQTEFAKTIHASGKELLTLINDILDLSKIESGTVVVDVGDLRLPEFLDYVERNFRHVAEAKGVGFQIEVGRDVPRAIVTDSTRFQQVIKNLLSNAFKFTERGSVTLRVETARDGWSRQVDTLNRARSVLAISVADTGIGISLEKQQIIFEAFQQADGSTNRKYGGTGLGLAISREIARLLGGEIRLSSMPGVGSTFTLFLPQVYVAQKTIRAAVAPSVDSVAALMPPAETAAAPAPPESFAAGEVADDRADLGPEDRVLLIIDNDEVFARFLMEMARENGFKALVAMQGADGIALAQSHRIDAITLDIRLPVIDGWRVLDRLKNDLDTRHIPVYLITTEEDAARGLSRGAVGALVKPIREKETLDGVFVALRGVLDRRQKDLLLIADEDGEAAIIADSLAQPAVRVRSVPSRSEALEALAQGRFDAVVAEVLTSRGEIEGWQEIVRECGSRQVPVLLFTPRELSAAEEEGLQRYSRLATVKRVRSVDRLADQIALFLHVPVAQLPDAPRQQVAQLYSNSVLAGKKVLIVDDDIRNIFAITSVLERQEMVVFPAETGQEAVEKLLVSDRVDIVLMDIMMPGMDGFDTMQEIRKIEKLRSLPIIAVTAKAMKGDREKTLQAGAWDYLAKPVDTDHMLSVLRSWLHR